MKKDKIIEVLFLIIGNILVAVGVAFFIIPNNIIMGGTTGVSIVLHHWWSIPEEITIYIISIATFILGFIMLGKKFAAQTVFSTFFYPFCLSFFNRMDVHITDNPLLATIYGGLFLGVGMGLVFRTGSSTGGLDTPPLIMNRLKGWSIPVQINIYDTIILLFGLTTTTIEQGLYGVLITLIMAITLSKVEIVGKSQTQVLIITKKYKEINQAILENLARGTTLLESVSGYKSNPQRLILSVVNNRQVSEVNKIVYEIDQDAFMIVTPVNEVRGRGFSK